MADNYIIIDLEHITNTCFIMMPFHTLFKDEYEMVIQPAVQDAGLKCVRGDEIYTQQSIAHGIWKLIREARVIIAELSGRNPNVMYEIGLAHAIGKPIIFLTRNEEDVPFNLESLKYLYYDPNDPFWGVHLRAELTKLLRIVLEMSSPETHLAGIKVQANLPELPSQPVTHAETQVSELDFSGVWNASWLSIKRGREHKATLAIPTGHGRNFVASLTVDFIREGKRTIVQETLSGTARESKLTLTGVNYTYVEQGSSRSYSLDSFELELSDDRQSMKGKAILLHGKRDVIFNRLSGPINKSA
jgi:hypothetical protein